MNIEPMRKPQGKLADAELEMVLGVIRRGLVDGDKIEDLERRIVTMVGSLTEAKKRLLNLNRIGQEICRHYERTLNPNRQAPLTATEALERIKWVQQKSNELKAQLD